MIIAGPGIASSRRLPVVSPNQILVDRVDRLQSHRVRSTVHGRGTRLAGLAPKSDNTGFRCTLSLGMMNRYGCNGTGCYPTLGPGQVACHGLGCPARGELQVSGGQALGRGVKPQATSTSSYSVLPLCWPAMLRPTIQAASYGSSCCSASHPAYVPVPSIACPEYGAAPVLTPRHKAGGFSPPPPFKHPPGKATAKPA